MAYTRITTLWNGAPGLPGYSRLHYMEDLDATAASAAAGALRFFFDSLKGYFPSDVTFSWDGVAEHFDISGALIGQVNYTVPATVTGNSTAVYSAASGAHINWNTTQFLNGRRVQGRTYLVPLASGTYDLNGSLGESFLFSVRGASATLIAEEQQLAVIGGSLGTVRVPCPVVSATIPDRVTVLRSRRD